jgi:hypothetical protein
MLVAKADRETVPEIDQAYQCGEVDQLLILEVPADFVVGRIGRMRFRDKGRSIDGLSIR